ncbi:MAG: hypothetical protein R3301_15085 [Saprospiraceae bacterium]|nr:hypothetical protein [Saprospiraceae bacterium]
MRHSLHLLLFLIVLTTSSCTVQYLLADTTSDTVVEYQDNYYVAHSPDSLLEFHYDFWQVNGTLWLSTLNRSDSLVLLRTDSCTLRYQGFRYRFDHFQDWEEYVQPLLGDSAITLLEPDEILPLLPRQWKGLLGPDLSFDLKNWKSYAEGVSYDRSDSPLDLEVRLCYQVGRPSSPLRCTMHRLWVEHVKYLRARDFRAMQTPEFSTSDKFYMLRMPGAGGASLLAGILSAMLFL